MATLSLARKGAIILGATLALATLSGSAEARYYGCWGCGAFAAGAIAGAAIAAPYAPPVYYAPRPVYVAPPVAPVVRGARADGRLSGLPGPASLSLLLPLSSGRSPHACLGKNQSERSIGAR